ncbi:MAG: response regulator [Armatimonadetes bacterium]|nr:response regulator [Anaerolineae bacterium]
MPNHTILLVEDNPDDIALTLRAFKKVEPPCEVIVARDGVEALAYLLGEGDAHIMPLSAPPALVLLDLKLPRLDGLELLRRLRAHPRTTWLPIVMLTSSSEPSDLANCYRSGANSYIKKPVDYTEFMAAVQGIGAYWLTLNTVPSSP